LGSAIVRGLGAAGVQVGILARGEDRARELAAEVEEGGGSALPLPADVLSRESLEQAGDRMAERFGGIDVLINAAGGNLPEAVVPDDADIFALDTQAFRQVVDLNLVGALLPIQVFGPVITRRGAGSIVNISSMSAARALSRTIGYGAAKAALEALTRSMAVETARRFDSGIRVNAIAPGFFIGEQNRELLLNPDGSLTDRSRRILEQTPMGRFGEPEDLVGTVVWLASDASRFVTGAVIPVDGGFAAFAGV